MTILEFLFDWHGVVTILGFILLVIMSYVAFFTEPYEDKDSKRRMI